AIGECPTIICSSSEYYANCCHTPDRTPVTSWDTPLCKLHCHLPQIHANQTFVIYPFHDFHLSPLPPPMVSKHSCTKNIVSVGVVFRICPDVAIGTLPLS